jgi:hypothetical protein
MADAGAVMKAAGAVSSGCKRCTGVRKGIVNQKEQLQLQA